MGVCPVVRSLWPIGYQLNSATSGRFPRHGGGGRQQWDMADHCAICALVRVSRLAGLAARLVCLCVRHPSRSKHAMSRRGREGAQHNAQHSTLLRSPLWLGLARAPWWLPMQVDGAKVAGRSCRANLAAHSQPTSQLAS